MCKFNAIFIKSWHEHDESICVTVVERKGWHGDETEMMSRQHFDDPVAHGDTGAKGSRCECVMQEDGVRPVTGCPTRRRYGNGEHARDGGVIPVTWCPMCRWHGNRGSCMKQTGTVQTRGSSRITQHSSTMVVTMLYLWSVCFRGGTSLTGSSCSHDSSRSRS